MIFEFACEFNFTAESLLHERKEKNSQGRELAFNFRLLFFIEIY